MLKLTVIKETRKDEKRVAITPNIIKKLHAINIKVFIESGAGILSGFSDDDYHNAGAEVTKDKSKLYQKTDIVCWFKRPENDTIEIEYIPDSAILIGFLDPLKPGKHIQHYLSKNITCLALELIPDIEIFKSMHAFSRMGNLAGSAAYQHGLKKFKKYNKYNSSPKILVIGTGNAGLSAAAQAYKDQYSLTIAGTNIQKMDYIKKKFKAHFLLLDNNLNIDTAQLLRLQQQQLLDEINQSQPNIIITTARRYGQSSPILLNTVCLDTLPPGTVIEDLTASIGGNTSLTQYDSSIKTPSGAFIHNRSNYPSEIPRQASLEYADCMLALLCYIKKNKQQSLPQKILDDSLLNKAVISKEVYKKIKI